MTYSSIRGSGRTTAQLKALPHGGVYVSCNWKCVSYDMRLAYSLGREDISIVSPDRITDNRWQGREFTAIDVDHAFPSTSRQTDLFYELLARAKTRIRK